MSTDPLPYVVEPGYIHVDIIDRPDKGSYGLLTYKDGSVRFEHLCDRRERGSIITAVLLCIGPHAGGPGGTHTLTYNGARQPTVRASVLCPDCGTHGFITDGRWQDA